MEKRLKLAIKSSFHQFGMHIVLLHQLIDLLFLYHYSVFDYILLKLLLWLHQIKKICYSVVLGAKFTELTSMMTMESLCRQIVIFIQRHTKLIILILRVA